MKLIAPLLIAAFVAATSFSAFANDAKPEAAKAAKPDLAKAKPASVRCAQPVTAPTAIPERQPTQNLRSSTRNIW